jgi:hypothetical protein
MAVNMKRATRRNVDDAPVEAASVAVHPAAKACKGCGDCANGAATRKPRNRAETIRVRAYELWEAAGGPSGDGVEFWLAAERESHDFG